MMFNIYSGLYDGKEESKRKKEKDSGIADKFDEEFDKEFEAIKGKVNSGMKAGIKAVGETAAAGMRTTARTMKYGYAGVLLGGVLGLAGGIMGGEAIYDAVENMPTVARYVIDAGLGTVACYVGAHLVGEAGAYLGLLRSKKDLAKAKGSIENFFEDGGD